jgi:hypothetical protein
MIKSGSSGVYSKEQTKECTWRGVVVVVATSSRCILYIVCAVVHVECNIAYDRIFT